MLQVVSFTCGSQAHTFAKLYAGQLVQQPHTRHFRNAVVQFTNLSLMACGMPFLVFCSSLGFAGTILLRSEEDLAYALQRGPLTMLAEVGQPWDTEQQQDGMHSAL